MVACHVVVTHYGCVILMHACLVQCRCRNLTTHASFAELKTKKTIGPHLTFVYTTIENIKYEEVFNNIILSII